MHSFTDDLHEDALFPSAIKLSVKDLLPRLEVQLSIGDGDHNLPTHGLTFQMGSEIPATRLGKGDPSNRGEPESVEPLTLEYLLPHEPVLHEAEGKVD